MRKDKVTKIVSLLLISAIGITALTGCAGQDVSSTESEVVEFDLKKVVKNLDDGGYYVVNNNNPKKIYFGNANFESGSTITHSDPDEKTDRVMWYTDEDYKNIPTFYSGDVLIYYSTEELTEKINFERFEDLGKTIGVCGLEQTESGRYKFDTSKTENVYPGHDTEKLFDFPQDSVILDEIGGESIREPNISRCGSIYGLPSDKTYKCKVYGGTEVTEINFKADVRAFDSYQQYTSNDYTFLSTNVIQINIPEWFNTGYYCIDGLGMFRYVVGKEYSKKTDFNVRNNNPEDDDSSMVSQEQKTDAFFLASNELGEKTLTIKLGAPAEDAVPITAELVLTDPDGKQYRAAELSENEIVLNFTADKVGEYKIAIVNLGSRTYSSEITALTE